MEIFVGKDRKSGYFGVIKKTTKYIPTGKLRIFYYPEQKGPLYYIDLKEV